MNAENGKIDFRMRSKDGKKKFLDACLKRGEHPAEVLRRMCNVYVEEADRMHAAKVFVPQEKA